MINGAAGDSAGPDLYRSLDASIPAPILIAALNQTRDDTQRRDQRSNGVKSEINRRAVIVSLNWIFSLMFVRNAGAGTMRKPPSHFDFGYFESLPQNERLPKAQEFVAQHFPPGSRLERMLAEFTNAGAKCGKGVTREGITYFECDYNISGRGFPGILFTTEWKIVAYPDETETNILSIGVNRNLAGL
jgi:hypothetical protein